MKAITEKLLRFLELVNVSGAVDIKECIIEGNKTLAKVYAKTPSNTFALKATIKGDYSDLETIGINDLILLRKVIALNKTSKETEIAKKENAIVCKSKGTKTRLILRNPKYILTALEEKTYEEKRKALLGNLFTLKKKDINKLSDFYDVMKGKIDISGKDNEITFKIGKDENISEIVIEVEEKVESFKTSIAGFFIETLKQINLDATVNAKTDLPIIVNAKDDDIDIEYLFAPLKRSEEE